MCSMNSGKLKEMIDQNIVQVPSRAVKIIYFCLANNAGVECLREGAFHQDIVHFDGIQWISQPDLMQLLCSFRQPEAKAAWFCRPCVLSDSDK